jgi:predicted DNA-binding transcriptional regulator AlpA
MLYTTKEEAQTAADLVDCKVTEAGDRWTIEDILLTADQVADRLEVSKRKVWYLNEDWKKDTTGTLPKENKITKGSTRWTLADILEYKRKRIRDGT